MFLIGYLELNPLSPDVHEEPVLLTEVAQLIVLHHLHLLLLLLLYPFIDLTNVKTPK